MNKRRKVLFAKRVKVMKRTKKRLTMRNVKMTKMITTKMINAVKIKSATTTMIMKTMMNVVKINNMTTMMTMKTREMERMTRMNATKTVMEMKMKREVNILLEQ